jgi:hypothetical protein
MSEHGAQKIEAILGHIKELVIIGKKVKADGKVSMEDLPHVIGILPKLPKMVEDFKHFGAAIEEGKDIDVAEVVAVIQKLHAMVKEIEAA